MTGKTTIEWATAVWNPTTGCTRVSAGCDNCYAFALHDKRYKVNRDAAEAGGVRGHQLDTRDRRDFAQVARERGIPLPYPRQYDLPFSRVQLLPDRIDDPLRHRKPERYFVDSMADLFHEDVPDGFIARVWMTMVQAGWHDFLVLTKRPARMRDFVMRWNDVAGDAAVDPMGGGRERGGDATRARYTSGRAHLFAAALDSMGTPPKGAAYPTYDWMEGPRFWPKFPSPNIWLGTSVEDQRAADERIPHLLATPAAVRFLSCEPLIGPVDLAHVSRWRTPHEGDRAGFTDALHGRRYATNDHKPPYVSAGSDGTTGRIDWVIVGGESGPRARPMDLAWARSLVEQCRAAGVAPFVKQLGSRPIHELLAFGTDRPTGHMHPLTLRDRKGSDMAEWPEDLRVREFPR